MPITLNGTIEEIAETLADYAVDAIYGYGQDFVHQWERDEKKDTIKTAMIYQLKDLQVSSPSQ